MNKPNIIFWGDWYEAIEALPDAAVRAEAYSALINYGLTGEDYQGNDTCVKLLMSFVGRILDEQRDAYFNKIEANRNNGKKGGAPIGNQNAKQPKTTQNNPKQPNGCKNNPNNLVKDKDKDKEVVQSTTCTTIGVDVLRNANTVRYEKICMDHHLSPAQYADLVSQFESWTVVSGHEPYTSENDIWRHFSYWVRKRLNEQAIQDKRLAAIPERRQSHQEAMDALIHSYDEGMARMQEEYNNNQLLIEHDEH